MSTLSWPINVRWYPRDHYSDGKHFSCYTFNVLLSLPLLPRELQIHYLLTLSISFSKWMRSRCSEEGLNSTLCSKVIRKVLMWWMQGDPKRKPACSPWNGLLRCSLIRSRIILADIFATAVNMQKLLNCRTQDTPYSSYFEILTIISLLQSLRKIS